MGSKKEFRKLLLERRKQIQLSDREEYSVKICEKLSTTDLSKVHSIHYYDPILSLGEVNIRPFVTFIKKTYPSISLTYSKKIHEQWKNVFEHGEIISSNMLFDLIIVPMLGFDSSLHRIGYGGGYYDKLLAQQRQSLKIGVCFEACKIDKIPVEAHDVPLDRIISEITLHT